MILKVEFTDKTDRALKIEANKNKFLTGEDNILEGNFLYFDDTQPIEYQLNDIKNNTDMIILKQEGLI